MLKLKKKKLKIYNKLNLCNIKNVIFFFWFFRILKCVTKQECVTSKVGKDPRGYCSFYIRCNVNLSEKFLGIPIGFLS